MHGNPIDQDESADVVAQVSADGRTDPPGGPGDHDRARL